MNSRNTLGVLLVAAFLGSHPGSAAGAASSSANYTISADSVDTGGAQASSTNYASTGSAGEISGIATVTSPSETIKSGYVGQLYQVTGLLLNSTFANNGSTQQLIAMQTLDDGTAIVLLGNSQTWNVVAGQLPAGLTLNPSTGVISGTPSGSGSYSFTILVTDGLGNSAQQTFSTPQTFSQWEAQYPQLTETSPSATPLNDGVDNLLKYVFDIDPVRAMTSADRAALPTVSLTTMGAPATEYLALTYRQNQFLNGVTVTVQTTEDLQTWTTVNPADLLQQVGTDSSTGDPIMEIGVRVSGAQKQFIRLNVTMP